MTEVVPITWKACARLIDEWHRHLDAPAGSRFAAALAIDGEVVYVPGPAGLAILSINTFPDGYEGISSVPIKELPQEALRRLGLQ